MKTTNCISVFCIAYFLFAIDAPPLFAQNQPTSIGISKTRHLGVATGFGWSKQHINYAFAFNEKFKLANVFSIALQCSGPLSEKLHWQTELSLTQHGYRVEKTVTSSGVKTKAKADTRLRYLEAPFLLGYRIPLGAKRLELWAMPGINLGYAISGKVVARGSGENETRKVFTKVTDKISFKEIKFGDRLDAAFLLGVKAAYPLGFGKIFAEARYHFGILNLDRNNETDITEGGDKSFNRTLLIRLGYQYALYAN